MIAAERSYIRRKYQTLTWTNPPSCIPKFALYISRPFLRILHVCVNSVNINFTLNLKQGVFIDRIYRINHTETWNFNAPTLVTSVSHKITAKCGILCPKTLPLTEKQLHAIHFFVAIRNVCPLAIPESCAQNMGYSGLLHSLWVQYFGKRIGTWNRGYWFEFCIDGRNLQRIFTFQLVFNDF